MAVVYELVFELGILTEVIPRCVRAAYVVQWYGVP